jgi:hypothetical protein
MKMQTPMLTIQYLEDSPDLARMDKSFVVGKLRAAAERLPLSHLLIGWHLPAYLLDACREEAERLVVRFLRWQPLLTSDKAIKTTPSWQTESLSGHKVAGYHALPEFTFFCPNHPAVQEALYGHMQDLAHQGVYQGFFLDRVRFPSPASDPLNDLACFCEHCRHKAAEHGLDLEHIRDEILRQMRDQKGRISLIETLLSRAINPAQAVQNSDLIQFLAFRRSSVRDFIALITQPLREAHLEIGLDCYSPCLALMVGQDLSLLSEHVDWIKIMTYAHTFAPAGIPYELSGLLHFLSSTGQLREDQAINLISRAIELPLPESQLLLEKPGLSTRALEMEVKRGVAACSVPVLAGMELVELEGVTYLQPDQIEADLTGLKRAGPAGLALSWDLLHIPPESLDLVRKVYLGNK